MRKTSFSDVSPGVTGLFQHCAPRPAVVAPRATYLKYALGVGYAGGLAPWHNHFGRPNRRLAPSTQLYLREYLTTQSCGARQRLFSYRSSRKAPAYATLRNKPHSKESSILVQGRQLVRLSIISRTLQKATPNVCLHAVARKHVVYSFAAHNNCSIIRCLKASLSG